MSKHTATTEVDPTVEVETPTFFQKAKTFVKNHKKPAIAVGALVGLVGVAAVTGSTVRDSSDRRQTTEDVEDAVNDSPELN